MNNLIKNSFLIISSISILVYFTGCANPNTNSSKNEYNNSKKSTKEASKKSLYSELLKYKGKQTKKDIVLLNKTPIPLHIVSDKHDYQNTKISKDGKTVIMGSTAYSLNPFKPIFRITKEKVIVLDFYDNDHVFFAGDKNYGMYNFKTKKFTWQYKISDNFEDISYSNGIIKYKWSKKTGRITWTLYSTYFKINHKNKGSRLKHLGDELTKGMDIIVNDNQTYALEIWDIDKVSLVNLKNNSRRNISNKVKRCLYEVTSFITNNSFQCGLSAYKIPSLEEIPYPNGGTASRIISPSKAIAKIGDQLVLQNFKTKKTLNSTKSNLNPFRALYKNNILINNDKGIDFNIYDISKFLGNTKTKLFNAVWLKVDKIKKKKPTIDEKIAIEEALNIKYKHAIKINPKSFTIKGNTVEVMLNNLGKFTFKSKNIIKNLESKYYLENTKFKIQDDTIKLISADLYPTNSGYILSYGKTPPEYKISPTKTIKKYKLTKNQRSKLNRANKMYAAGLKDEYSLIINNLVKTNPIGLQLETSGKSQPFYVYSNITSNTIRELRKHKLYYLDINTKDTDNLLDNGVVVKKVFSNKNFNIGDKILSIDSFPVLREHDIREIINNIEDPKNIEIEILRNKIKTNINTEANSIFRYSDKLFNTYSYYIINAIKSIHPNIAREAFTQLGNDLDNFVITKDKKEKLLLLDSLILAAQGQSDKAIKNLFNYEKEFEKSSISYLINSDKSGWAPLLEEKEKLAILFNIPISKFKSPKLGKQYDYYDINGNLQKANNIQEIIKKEIEPSLQIQSQPSLQKGGVLE